MKEYIVSQSEQHLGKYHPFVKGDAIYCMDTTNGKVFKLNEELTERGNEAMDDWDTEAIVLEGWDVQEVKSFLP